MDRIDKRIDLMQKLQEEMDHRTRVEEEAIRLIGECEFEKANALLKSLDDELLRQIQEELNALEGEVSEDTCQGEQKETENVDILVEGMVIEGDQQKDPGGHKALRRYAGAVRDEKSKK